MTKAKKINTEHRLSVTERILQTSGFARDAAGLKALTNTAKGLLWKRRQARLQTRDFVAQNAAAAKSTKRVQRSRRNKPLSGHTRVSHARNPAATIRPLTRPACTVHAPQRIRPPGERPG